METIDFGAYMVGYNFVIGVLVMLASQKVATLTGNLNRANRTKIVRVTYVSSFTFGACVAVLSGTIYIAFHLLKIGL